MNNKEEKYFQTGVRVVKIIFAVVAVLLMFYFVIGEIVMPDERDQAVGTCEPYVGEWNRVLENGEQVPVEIPGSVNAKWGEEVKLVTVLPDTIQASQVICFRPVWQDVTVYVDGELRSSYSTKETRPFGTNSAFRYVFAELNAGDAGKELTYCFSTESKYAGVVRRIYIGDRSAIWTHLVKEAAFKMIVAILLLTLSLFCIITCFVLRIVYKKSLSLNYLAWSLFYCALWMLSETEFRQLIFPNVSVVTGLTYWSLMLMPFPFLIYMDDVQNGRYRKLYVFPIVYSILVLFIGTFLQVFDVVQFVTQLPFIHGGIGISMACIIGAITYDAIKKRLSDYFFVGLGIYGMLMFAIFEIILYYMDSVYTLGTMIMMGMLFLLIMAIIKTGQDLFASEQKKQQAIMASKAQAQFLASMSHEIRTPINAVIGMNEMILRENENETIQEYAHNIQSSSNMLLGLVNDVLDFSKIESGQLELVESEYHLGSLLQDELLLLNARAAGKPISTQIEADAELPSELYGDEIRIKQIVTNLLSNAVKYTKEGNVKLKASYIWIDDENIMLKIAVEDTGIGIRAEDLEKLFDSFKRLELSKNRNIEGTGLGLNIAKSLVELMDGYITVESEYGKGSTFTVSVPQRVVDKKPIGNLEENVRKYRNATMKPGQKFTAPEANILVVDDNMMNLTVIGALLKRTKVQVDCAESGKKCLEFSKEKAYDVILMDHMMPEMDGIETLHKLREDDGNLNQKAVVIALTANAIAGCREMYLEHGFDDYCSKPIKADTLDALLLRYLPENLVQPVEE